MKIAVAQYGEHLRPALFAGATIVAIDVLRATTTIAAALANGAREVIPVSTVEEARRLVDGVVPRPLLAGESGNAKVAGFDLGNSPLEFDGRVRGCSVVFRTTNGTQVLSAFAGSANVYCAAFVNLHAVVRAIVSEQCEDVLLVCAGQEGRFSLEDFLCAGALVEVVTRDRNAALEDAAQAAAAAYRASSAHLEKTLAHGTHAQALIAIGLRDDVRFAAQIDRYDVVPRLIEGRIIAV